MNVLSAIVLLLAAAGCSASKSGLDGVYATPREVAGFFGETLELHGGHFSLWAYSDVALPHSVKYPIHGSYRVEGGYVILEGADVHSPRRFIVEFQGQRFLLREDSVHAWQSGQKLYPYGCLIRTDIRPEALTFTNLPSVTLFGAQHVAEYY
jgi:hypothetical protein